MRKIRQAALALLTAVAACGLSPGPSEGPDLFAGETTDDCLTVLVDNQNFADVVITHGPTYQRVGLATGKMTSTFDLCRAGNTESLFNLHAIGGAFTKVVEGHQKLQNGVPVKIIIAAGSQHQTQIIGFNGPVDRDGFFVFGLTPVQPHGIHIGIWADVATCLGLNPIPPIDVEWYTGEALIDADLGALLYGATTFDVETGEPLAIYLDRDYFFHAGVVSHEISHAVAGPDEPTSCLMPVPGDLPLRPLTEEYRDRLSG